MEQDPFKLHLINDVVIEIPRTLIKYFGFFNAIHTDVGIDEFVESKTHTLDASLWEFIIGAYRHYDEEMDDDEEEDKETHSLYAHVAETLKVLAFDDLYRLIRVADFYEVTLFMMATIKALMLRLLCMTPEQLRVTHHMKRTLEPTTPTTVIEAILPDYAKHRAMLDTILQNKIGIASLIQVIETRFLPRAEHFVAAGFMYSIVLTSRGVFSIGQNDYGQLGRDGEKYQFRWVPLQGVISVTATLTTSYFLTQCGVLYSVGNNVGGQLGHEMNRKNPNKPARVENLDLVLSVSCGYDHVIALTADGVYAWGDNRNGQLGNGTLIGRSIPTRIEIDASIVKIVAVLGSSVMLSDKGDLYACGSNANGHLGLGTEDNVTLPTLVPLPAPVQDVACSIYGMVILLRDGTLYQCGRVAPDEKPFFVPTQITSFTTIPIERLFSSADNIMALDANDAFYITSEDIVESRPAFTRLLDAPSGIIDAARSVSHTLLLRRDGLYGMGSPVGLGLEHSMGVPTRLPLKVGHEKYATLPLGFTEKKRRKLETLSCHLCATGSAENLFLHQTSKKLFCGIVCMQSYMNL